MLVDAAPAQGHVAAAAHDLDETVGALTGYTLSFWRVRGAGVLFGSLMIVAFIPYQIFIYPLVRIFAFAGVSNSIPAIVIVHTIFGLPVLTLLFRNYFSSLPLELFKAARIDGARELRLFVSIVLSIPLGVKAATTRGKWPDQAIRVFSLIGRAYSFKFLWSPLLDRINLPLIRRLGRRKQWIVTAQFLRARAEQRAWTLRRNRACGFDANKAGGNAGSGYDDPADCLQAETERRTRQLAALRAGPALGARLRTVLLTEGHPGSRLHIQAERPEIADPAYPGAVAFNDTVRRYVDGEIRRFRESSADLPNQIEAELILTADSYVVTPALLSVQFRGEGVQGNGFRYAAALTVDLVRGDVPTLARMFGAESWLTVAIAACRRELAADPDLVPECDGPDLRDPRSWRFEPDRAVATLLLPGKELREIAIPFHPSTR